MRTRHITIIYTTRDAGAYPLSIAHGSVDGVLASLWERSVHSDYFYMTSLSLPIADISEMAEYYRETLESLAHRLTTNNATKSKSSSPQAEVYCHVSSLVSSSSDYDPEQAAHVPEKSIIASPPTALFQDPSAADGALSRRMQAEEQSCCCDSSANTSSQDCAEIEPAPHGKKGKKNLDGSDSEGSSYSRSSTNLANSDTNKPVYVLAGRPDIPAHVRRLAGFYGTAAIAVCGPKELVFDARNAVAQEQLGIVRGDTACTDLYLHTEVFEW
jgi:hypothetical protein